MLSFDKNYCPLCDEKTITKNHSHIFSHHTPYNHEFIIDTRSNEIHVTFSAVDGIAHKFLFDRNIYRNHDGSSLTMVYMNRKDFSKNLVAFKELVIFLDNYRLLK